MNWYSTANIAEHFELNKDWLDVFIKKCDILGRYDKKSDSLLLAENQYQILVDKLEEQGYIRNQVEGE